VGVRCVAHGAKLSPVAVHLLPCGDAAYANGGVVKSQLSDSHEGRSRPIEQDLADAFCPTDVSLIVPELLHSSKQPGPDLTDNRKD
jgi:hypothetical protein